MRAPKIFFRDTFFNSHVVKTCDNYILVFGRLCDNLAKFVATLESIFDNLTILHNLFVSDLLWHKIDPSIFGRFDHIILKFQLRLIHFGIISLIFRIGPVNAQMSQVKDSFLEVFGRFPAKFPPALTFGTS